MPKLNRRKSIVIGTVTLGVLGAGFAGVASAGTVPWRHHNPSAAGQHRPFAYGEGVRASRSWDPNGNWNGRGHHPRPSGSASYPTGKPTAQPTNPPTDPKPTDPGPAPTTKPPAPAPTTTATPTNPGSSDEQKLIQAAFDYVNAFRAKQGRPAFKLDASLNKVADSHATNMANGCGMSHKCPNEDELGPRFSSFGVQWNSIGENVAQGNASTDLADMIKNTNGLCDLFIGEGPGGGHFENLNSTGFTRIGLAAKRASDGKLYYSQEFAN